MITRKTICKAINIFFALSLSAHIGTASAQDDFEPFVHEEVFVEVTKPMSNSVKRGQIKVRLPNDKNCRVCGDYLEIDEDTRLVLRSTGSVVNIRSLSQYTPASGQVDVQRKGYAVLIQLDN